jgi:hypothetical protein
MENGLAHCHLCSMLNTYAKVLGKVDTFCLSESVAAFLYLQGKGASFKEREEQGVTADVCLLDKLLHLIQRKLCSVQIVSSVNCMHVSVHYVRYNPTYRSHLLRIKSLLDIPHAAVIAYNQSSYCLSISKN